MSTKRRGRPRQDLSSEDKAVVEDAKRAVDDRRVRSREHELIREALASIDGAARLLRQAAALRKGRAPRSVDETSKRALEYFVEPLPEQQKRKILDYAGEGPGSELRSQAALVLVVGWFVRAERFRVIREGVDLPNEDPETSMIAELQARGFSDTRIARALSSLGRDGLQTESKRKRAQRGKKAASFSLNKLDPELLTSALPDGKLAAQWFEALSSDEQRMFVNLLAMGSDWLEANFGTGAKKPLSTK